MHIYRLTIFLVIGSYLLSPILIHSWGQTGRSWYWPFVIWLAVIVVAAWIEHQRGRDEL